MASITRLYDNHDKAMAVRRELTEAGFTDDQITVVKAARGNPAESQSGRHDQVISELAAAGLSGSDAAGYAERMRRGAVLLSVNAPFGRGAQATSIMDAHAQTDPGSAQREPASGTTSSRGLIDEPAPLSKLLHVPVLLNDSETD
jgi:hypothetical protein